MSLKDAKNLNLDELSNMEKALKSNKQLAAAIDEREKYYHTVDISMAMTNLGKVGDTLKKAYVDIKSFPCSEITLKTILQYQTLIKNSYVTSSLFVCACLKALQLHKLALVMAEKGKMDNSIKMLEKCAELAKTIADECKKLVKELTELCNLSEEALITVQSDEYVSVKEKKRTMSMMTDAKMSHAEKEIKIGHSIAIRQENLILKLKAAEWREEEEYAFEILNSLGRQEDYFSPLIESLAMVRRALKHVMQFWLGVEKHCKALTDVSAMEVLNDPVFKDEFIDELKMSCLSWLTLGKINYSAQLDISNVDNNILTSLQNVDNDLLSDLLSCF